MKSHWMTCDRTPNPSQVDTDGDGVMDLHDNCKRTFNPGQRDSDGDGNGCDDL